MDAKAGIGDRRCMAYSGTLVAAGRGVGVVVATGAATELGRISRMMAEVESLATPLTRQMAAFGKVLSLRDPRDGCRDVFDRLAAARLWH